MITWLHVDHVVIKVKKNKKTIPPEIVERRRDFRRKKMESNILINTGEYQTLQPRGWKTTLICHSLDSLVISRSILPLSLLWGGVGQDEGERAERQREGADSRLGVLLCVAVFRISTARRLRSNPWRLLPCEGNTSFLQTDRSDFYSLNNQSEREDRNPEETGQESCGEKSSHWCFHEKANCNICLRRDL